MRAPARSSIPTSLLIHKVATIELPARMVTEAEAAEARSKVETLSKDPRNRRLVVWHGDVVDRYERQKAGTAEPSRWNCM